MSSFKVIVLLLVVASCCGLSIPRDVHNIYACINPEIEKEVLLFTTVSIDGAFLLTQRDSITFPQPPALNTKIITCVVVTNKDTDGTGGYPTIAAGGISQTMVQLDFESQFSQGLHFDVAVYADKAA